VVPMLELDTDGFEIETEMNIRVLRRGLKVAEVPSFESERVYGVGRLRTIPDGWRVLKTIFRERFRSPLGPVVRPVPAALAGVGSPVMADRSARFPMAFEILRGDVAPEIQALVEQHDPHAAPVAVGHE